MKPIRRDELATLVILLAIILGVFVRFTPTYIAGFAINDGGMFAVMVDDLKISHYALPIYTSYNGLNIPFAYPPLGFYLGRLVADMTGMAAEEVLRWLPALFASLAVPAFYLLALRLMKSRFHAALATLIFALMPRAMSLFVMGGGLTRSPGQFFMLLTLASVVRLYGEGRRRDIIWSGVWGALAVLSHPEIAVNTAVSCVFLWIMLARNRKGLWHSAQVAFLVLLFTSPWWAVVISRHGLAPILAAAQTGQKLLAVFHLVFFSFTEEVYATPIAILGLIGLGLFISRKDYLLPLWLILPFFAEGRSAAGPAAIPLAMLAASGFADVVLPGLRKAGGSDIAEDQLGVMERSALLYLFVYLLFSAYTFGWQISSTTVYAPDREAMLWVKENTPGNARFLVLSGARNVSYDPLPEWFPALAQRSSIYTVQGSEWVSGKDFGAFVQKAIEVQSCVSQGFDCMEKATGADKYDYVYLSRNLRAESFEPLPYALTFPFFEDKLKADGRFEQVYESGDVLVFRRR